MKSGVCHQRCRQATRLHLSRLHTNNERNERLHAAVRLYQSRPQNIRGGATSLVHLAWEPHGLPLSHTTTTSVSILLGYVTFGVVVALFQVNGQRWFTDFIINCWVLWFRRPLRTSRKWICWAQWDSGAKSCISLLPARVFQLISKSEAVVFLSCGVISGEHVRRATWTARRLLKCLAAPLMGSALKSSQHSRLSARFLRHKIGIPLWHHVTTKAFPNSC